MRHSIDDLIFAGLGLLALLVQVTLIRQLLADFSGNELEIGLTLAVWLLTFGLGSIAGHRVPGGRLSFAILLGCAAALVQPTILSVRFLRNVLDLVVGEIPTLGTTVLAISVCVTPVALVAGTLFPLAVRHAGAGQYAAGRVYALEAAGALVGGVLFAFVFSTRLDALTLGVIVAAAYLLLAAAVLRKPVFLIVMMFPFALHVLSVGMGRDAGWERFDLVGRKESRYGEVVVVRSQRQYTVYEAGKPRFSYPDEQNDEQTAHTVMSLHPDPRNVLVIGGSPGLAKEFLKYPDVETTFVEENPALWEFARRTGAAWPSGDANDARFTLIRSGGITYLQDTPAIRRDLIVLEIPPPMTAATNRYFTVEFFRLVESRLSAGGVFVVRGIKSFGYTGKTARELNGTVLRTLENAFSEVILGSGESGLMIGTNAPLENSPEILIDRFTSRGVDTVTFTPLIFNETFSPTATANRLRELQGAGELNLNMKPVAYRVGLQHWADIQKSGVFRALLGAPPGWTISCLVALAAGAALFARRSWKRATGLAVFSTGMASMGLSITLILAFQAFHGYAYEAIALLTAAFMGGTALGGWLPGRLGRTRLLPETLLILLDVSFVLLLVSAPFLLAGVFPFYALNAICGALTGLLYGTANLTLSPDGSSPGIAGRLYGFDLIGSCLGTLIPVLFLIPRIGIPGTLITLSILKIASAASLGLVRFGTGGRDPGLPL